MTAQLAFSASPTACLLHRLTPPLASIMLPCCKTHHPLCIVPGNPRQLKARQPEREETPERLACCLAPRCGQNPPPHTPVVPSHACVRGGQFVEGGGNRTRRAVNMLIHVQIMIQIYSNIHTYAYAHTCIKQTQHRQAAHPHTCTHTPQDGTN